MEPVTQNLGHRNWHSGKVQNCPRLEQEVGSLAHVQLLPSEATWCSLVKPKIATAPPHSIRGQLWKPIFTYSSLRLLALIGMAEQRQAFAHVSRETTKLASDCSQDQLCDDAARFDLGSVSRTSKSLHLDRDFVHMQSWAWRACARVCKCLHFLAIKLTKEDHRRSPIRGWLCSCSQPSALLTTCTTWAILFLLPAAPALRHATRAPPTTRNYSFVSSLLFPVNRSTSGDYGKERNKLRWLRQVP